MNTSVWSSDTSETSEIRSVLVRMKYVFKHQELQIFGIWSQIKHIWVVFTNLKYCGSRNFKGGKNLN